MKILGIKNCDKVRKSLKWFDEKNIEYEFHDFRKDGMDENLIEQLLIHFEIEELFNKRSTTWRNLSNEDKDNLTPELLILNPTLIPRPVVLSEKMATLGYKPDIWNDA